MNVLPWDEVITIAHSNHHLGNRNISEYVGGIFFVQPLFTSKSQKIVGFFVFSSSGVSSVSSRFFREGIAPEVRQLIGWF